MWVRELLLLAFSGVLRRAGGVETRLTANLLAGLSGVQLALYASSNEINGRKLEHER